MRFFLAFAGGRIKNSYLMASLLRLLKILSWFSSMRGRIAAGSPAVKKMGIGPKRPDSWSNWSTVRSQEASIWVAMLSASSPGFDLWRA